MALFAIEIKLLFGRKFKKRKRKRGKTYFEFKDETSFLESDSKSVTNLDNSQPSISETSKETSDKGTSQQLQKVFFGSDDTTTLNKKDSRKKPKDYERLITEKQLNQEGITTSLEEIEKGHFDRNRELTAIEKKRKSAKEQNTVDQYLWTLPTISEIKKTIFVSCFGESSTDQIPSLVSISSDDNSTVSEITNNGVPEEVEINLGEGNSTVSGITSSRSF